MPWDDNSGGPGRSGGPWGQTPGGGSNGGGGPRRPGGGGGGTPNLEDILNRGRQQFGNTPGLPGGRWILLGVVAAAVVFWASQAIYTVAPQEVGVELLFGEPKEEASLPGLHFHWWPIERVERVSTTENQTRVGAGANDEGLMLSGDQNIVNMNFSILWRITDPAAYLFNVSDPDQMVRQAAESAMREVVGRRTAQDVFRDDRAGIAVEVQSITQQIIDTYGVGVAISNISIENVAPPAEVADAFDEVQRALQDEDRFQEEARQYSNTLLGNARGQAARIREDAAAYQDRVVNEAEGQAARFLSIFNEYALAPDVTRYRLFLETMEEVLGGANKVIVESGAGGSGVIPYLPLPELQNRGQSPNQSQTQSQVQVPTQSQTQRSQ